MCSVRSKKIKITRQFLLTCVPILTGFCEPHSAKMKAFSSQIMFLTMLLAFFCFNVYPVFAEHEHGSHLSFTENKGQWESNILFQADFRGGRLFLEKNDFTYVFYHPED